MTITTKGESRMKIYRELKGKFNIDALLFSDLGIVGAKLDHDQAKWDGVSQGAGKKTFLKALIGVSHDGAVPALSDVKTGKRGKTGVSGILPLFPISHTIPSFPSFPPPAALSGHGCYRGRCLLGRDHHLGAEPPEGG
jgi:hypothetical protein